MADILSSVDQVRVLTERLSSIFSRLPGVAIVSLLNAALIVIVIEREEYARSAWIWLALVASLSLVRAIFYLGYRADRSPRDRGWALYWQRVSVSGSFASGLLWGIGSLLIMGETSIDQWLWAFAIGGMCAGAASLHAAHLPSAFAFTLPACLPLALSLLFQGNFQAGAAGIMTLAFIGVTSFTAILFSKEFGRTLALKFALEYRAVELNNINGRLTREIADHHSTSEALYQSQKMEALGKLTGGFAHDFNNLLTVIIGNLDLIAAPAGEGRQKDLAATALAAAQSGASLTARLLAFARKQTLTPTLADINRIIAEFESLLRRAVPASIEFMFDFGAHAPIVHVDTTHFQAALLNLVVNARDAMPTGGLITISTARRQLDGDALVGTGSPPGDYVTIAVADDGSGMPPEIVERAFDPYFTTKTDSGGSGLGLSQVYGFARQSGGFVQLHSEAGCGSCVTIFIPASDAPLPIEDEVGAPAVARSGNRLSVLLVDDNVAVLHVLQAGLADQGWSIATALDGRSALDMIAQDPAYDIVVSDIDMPGEIDGLDLENEVRQRWPHLPVLLISGAPIPVGRLRPDTEFLTKPFRNHILLSKIESLL
jgi:signal transduction histidine kinase